MDMLITGGTGSLGQALADKYLNSNAVQRLCIYSRGEHRQEQMAQAFAKHPHKDKLRFFIGDVRDQDRLRMAMKGTHIVIHAAALKIVPTAEYNPFEALKTNVIGAQNVIEAALATVYGNYPQVLAVSTDKAVQPINLYGASKLCAEKLFIAANNIMGNHGPRFSVVRYGNVSNSNGSVIPLFQRQLNAGQQLTITHPEMTRFWITLDQAVNLINKALNNMRGGEIFVPDMRSFNVKDLADVMMHYAGYPPEKQWCEVIGVRPGEKLHETIITKEEMEKTLYVDPDGIWVINTILKKTPDVMPKYEDLTSNSPNVAKLTKVELWELLKELGVICDTTLSKLSENSSEQLVTIPAHPMSSQ